MQKCGLVALTDLRDSYIDKPLDGFQVSQVVRYVSLLLVERFL